MEPYQREIAEARINAERRQAEFDAMIHVTEAHDAGFISQRNCLKLDEKVNLSVIRYIQSEGNKYDQPIPVHL